eukprot:CAMPEP_0182448500 /NCGR_PEP_ID=MMETSP1172-20130603/27568_1 /TAXON_ID=708627 /ORGANISM="Timspurckia oligopyrenoides, Strain CCMP3278" /LENGTH=538 /DNA_ID=CAMNT_0024645387 /DNA_START=38 /DNA_END=1654 /DNA_ORIENTATION=+
MMSRCGARGDAAGCVCGDRCDWLCLDWSFDTMPSMLLDLRGRSHSQSVAHLKLARLLMAAPFVMFVVSALVVLLLSAPRSFNSLKQHIHDDSNQHQSNNNNNIHFNISLSNTQSFANQSSLQFMQANANTVSYFKSLPSIQRGCSCDKLMILYEPLRNFGFSQLALHIIAILGISLHSRIPFYSPPSQYLAEWPFDCGSGEAWNCYFYPAIDSCTTSNSSSSSSPQLRSQRLDLVASSFNLSNCHAMSSKMNLQRSTECWHSHTTMAQFIRFFKSLQVPSKLAFSRQIAPMVWNRHKTVISSDVSELLHETRLVQQQAAHISAAVPFVALDLRVGLNVDVNERLASQFVDPIVKALNELLLVGGNDDDNVLNSVEHIFVACNREFVLESVKKAKEVLSSSGSMKQWWSRVRIVSSFGSSVRQLKMLKMQQSYSSLHDDVISAVTDVELLRHAHVVIGRFSSSFSRLVQSLRVQHPSSFISVDYAWEVMYFSSELRHVGYCAKRMEANEKYCDRVSVQVSADEHSNTVPIVHTFRLYQT